MSGDRRSRRAYRFVIQSMSGNTERGADEKHEGGMGGAALAVVWTGGLNIAGYETKGDGCEERGRVSVESVGDSRDRGWVQ